MSSKVLVIIATGDKEKCLAGLMYARNAQARNWLEDVKVVFFGPSEKLIVQDEDCLSEALEVASLGETFACKAISDNDKVSEAIEELGIKVEYVGSIVSDFIKAGYVPMVW